MILESKFEDLSGSIDKDISASMKKINKYLDEEISKHTEFTENVKKVNDYLDSELTGGEEPNWGDMTKVLQNELKKMGIDVEEPNWGEMTKKPSKADKEVVFEKPKQPKGDQDPTPSSIDYELGDLLDSLDNLNLEEIVSDM